MITRPAIFKWRQTEPGLILCAVRWYLRYSLSLRDVEELLEERGLDVDLSFAKNRSYRFSGCTTHPTSQSSSSISGSSQRSTSIEWCWKSNHRQKTSNPRSRGQDCSSRNQPANCATKISSHSSCKTSRTSSPVSHSGIR